jgi:hypothetical protein
MQYANAAQAAAAATQAAMQAKAAADYAAQFAMFQAGVGAPGTAAAMPSVAQLPRSPLTINTLPGVRVCLLHGQG